MNSWGISSRRELYGRRERVSRVSPPVASSSTSQEVIVVSENEDIGEPVHSHSATPSRDPMDLLNGTLSSSPTIGSKKQHPFHVEEPPLHKKQSLPADGVSTQNMRKKFEHIRTLTPKPQCSDVQSPEVIDSDGDSIHSFEENRTIQILPGRRIPTPGIASIAPNKVLSTVQGYEDQLKSEFGPGPRHIDLKRPPYPPRIVKKSAQMRGKNTVSCPLAGAALIDLSDSTRILNGSL